MPIDIDVDIAVAIPVNVLPLLDDGDFKTRETSVAYNAAGMDLVWNFVTTGGVMTQTAVTPTTAGDYDWSHVGDGMYKIEIPASGGASINNNSEGAGWFSGVATGVLPWVSPVYRFRAAGLNDLLIDSAYSTTRGLAGTALPNAAAEASGGLATLSAAQASNGTVPANVHRWLTGTPNALISGRVDSNPGALQASVITATSIATGAITSAKFAAGAIDAAAIANSAIDAATFAADVDAEFLSYIVDDATRLDASALNTLSSHDPGETIMGATDLGTGSGLTSLATAAELAKVPKSDGTATWNATALASIQSEANDALVAYDPPTNAELEARTLVAASYATAANLATVAGYLDTEIAAILADTNELQTDWANGGRLDVILDARASQTSVDDLPTNAELTTALGTADDAVLAAIAALNNLSAAQVNAEVDTALADYDGPTNAEMVARTLVAADYATNTDLDALIATVGVAGDQLTAIPKTGYSLAATGLDLVLVAGVNVPEALRRIGAISAGEVSGAGTGEETFLDWAESAASVVITVDSSGNRTSVVFN